MSKLVNVANEIAINTTKNLFENNNFNDYLLIESLSKPYIYLRDIDIYVTNYVNITVKYNIIFKNYSKIDNVYRLYYKGFINKTLVDFNNFNTWNFILIRGLEEECTISNLILNENTCYALVIDYNISTDTNVDKLNINFNMKLPIIDINKNIEHYKIQDIDIVPFPSSVKVVSLNFAIINEDLVSTTKGISGTLYVLTKHTYYDDKTNVYIYVNGIKHYLLGLKESENSYTNLAGQRTQPVFNNFVSNLLSNFQAEPFNIENNTELVFIFQPYYKEKYYKCIQENVNISNTNVDLTNVYFNLQEISLDQTGNPEQKPSSSIQYSTHLNTNGSLFVMRLNEEVNIIKI